LHRAIPYLSDLLTMNRRSNDCDRSNDSYA